MRDLGLLASDLEDTDVADTCGPSDLSKAVMTFYGVANGFAPRGVALFSGDGCSPQSRERGVVSHLRLLEAAQHAEVGVNDDRCPERGVPVRPRLPESFAARGGEAVALSGAQGVEFGFESRCVSGHDGKNTYHTTECQG